MTNVSIGLQDRVLKSVAHRRGQILSIVESETKNPELWLKLRARILGIFGENGLSRDVRRIFEEQFDNEGGKK